MSNLWMQSRSGIPIPIEYPDPKLIRMDEVAHSLAGQPRYLAHTTKEHYSVAEHCVRVSYLLADWGEDEHMQMRGLIHDCPEAILGDITAPVKAVIRKHTHALDVIEDRWLYAFLDFVGLSHMRSNPPMPLALWERTQRTIKRADLVLLATERRDLMAPCDRDWNLTHEPLPKKLPHPLTSDRAERAFLDRFEELQAKRRMAA